MSASIVCTNCGAEGESNFSTNYFGELVCELCGTQSYLQTRTETQDAEDMGLDLLALQKMKRRTKRKKRERKIKEEVVRKPMQLLDVIVTTQFMLNKQAEALVKLGFPPETPRVVRDVWFHFLHVWQTKGARPFLRCFTEFHYNSLPEDKGMDPAVTSDVLEQWDAENASNLNRLFQPSQSTIPEEDDDGGVRSLPGEFKNKGSRDWQHTLDWFVLSDMVGLLVIAGRMLNVGAVPSDYAYWIERGDLPYSNMLSLCPLEIQEKVERVARFYDAALRTNWLSNAVIAYKTHYLQYHLEIRLPPLNAPLVAFNMCENLGLPPQVFRNFMWISAQFNIPGEMPEKPVQQKMATFYQDKSGSALDSAAGIAAYLLAAIRLCPNWMEWIYERVPKEENGPPYTIEAADRLPRRQLSAFVEYCEDMLLGDDRGRIPETFASHVDDLKTRLSVNKAHEFSRTYEENTLRAYMPEYENGVPVETTQEIQERVNEIKQKLQRSPYGSEDEKTSVEELERATSTYFYPDYMKNDRTVFHGPFEAALALLCEYIDVPMNVVLRWSDAIDLSMKHLSQSIMSDAVGLTAMLDRRRAIIKQKKEQKAKEAADRLREEQHESNEDAEEKMEEEEEEARAVDETDEKGDANDSDQDAEEKEMKEEKEDELKQEEAVEVQEPGDHAFNGEPNDDDAVDE